MKDQVENAQQMSNGFKVYIKKSNSVLKLYKLYLIDPLIFSQFYFGIKNIFIIF
jgi:hypothetical protein